MILTIVFVFGVMVALFSAWGIRGVAKASLTAGAVTLVGAFFALLMFGHPVAGVTLWDLMVAGICSALLVILIKRWRHRAAR